MCRRLVYLALIAGVCGLGTAQAQEWNRAAYWDGGYRTNWVNEQASVALRDGLSAAGYQILNAAQLKTWMNARIADGARSVVVFCRDNAPNTVVETVDASCTLRKYLDAGGKIVWPADIPFWDIALPGGTSTNYSATGSTAILGFYGANGTWDLNNTVKLTEDGTKWGLTKTWNSVRPALASSVDVVLATDEAGTAASAWVKHYLPHDTFRGFVRILDVSGQPDIEDVIRVAEYREAFPYALLVSPPDGGLIQKVEYTLKWQPGDFATSHNVYFTDDLDALNAGSVAPISTTETSLLVKDLARGATYYWRVDEVAEGNPASPWQSEVHSFIVQPLEAWNPYPADGGEYVKVGDKLTWNNGLGVIFHTVYFGEDLEEVTNATAGGTMVVEPALTPEMEAGKTYYWRVDEFTGTATNQGDVWSFTTVPVVAVSDPHLVGWWKLDEGKGNTAVDWSGYGNHGLLVGNPSWVDGLYGGALEFGPDRVVNCGVAAAEQVTGDFTLAAWVRLNPSNAGVYGGLGGRLAVIASNYYGFGIVRHSANVFRLWVGDGTTDLVKSAVSSDLVYSDTEWHHVAGVRQGQTNVLYIDGVRQAGSSTTSLAPSPEWFHIGRQYSHLNDRYFPGVIDDVRIYDVASDAAAIGQILQGDPTLAGDPEPANGTAVDIRGISDLAWSAGDTAASHDVYFGTDRQAVAGAGHESAEFRGNQTGTTLSLADLVTFGGGAYYWRIDEVEAGGTAVHKGYVWKFTVPPYLIVDDFESYTDAEGNRVYQTWEDGWTNKNSTSVVGHDAAPFAEQAIVNSGRQSMPLDYNNVNSPYFAEAELAWTTAQDWTVEGVAALSLAVRGSLSNGAGTLYVGLQDSTGKLTVVTSDDAQILTKESWTTWRIPLADFGVKVTAIKKIVIGVGDRNNPTPGGAGRIYIDDICLVLP